MTSRSSVNELYIEFPNAELGRLFFLKQCIRLEEQYGFTPENTHFAEGGCADEINEPEYLLMQHYWGERFKFGGLAGYCHGGKTGFAALSHHAPDMDANKNLLIVAGPHIGYQGGKWGEVLRKGQKEASSSCGSIAAIIEKGYEALYQKKPDPMDQQQYTVEQILLPFLEPYDKKSGSPSILDATRFLMHRINKDIQLMVNEMKDQFGGQIALITGVTINTDKENFFSPSIIKVG